MIENKIYQEFLPYEKRNDLYPTKGADTSKLNSGVSYGSMVNKLHLIKVLNSDADEERAYSNKSLFVPKTFSDLCKMKFGACQYDAEDFLYCSNLGTPINRLITLRRFPYPCTDNIYDIETQPQPDIARMVTYFNQEVNKLEDILTMVYRLKWRELTAEMSQANMIGDQSGFSGFMQKIMPLFDSTLADQAMMGENRLNYDPKHDNNKVYGPVDSIINTNIRDVGIEFEKSFEITFDYTLRSFSGRTPEFAMKDLLANALAVTYNNAKFWGGSRYWVGKRPSKFFEEFAFMNADSAEDFLFKSYSKLKNSLQGFKDDSKGSAVDALKSVLKNGFAIALGKILDTVGRPSILVMDSLLNNEPTGYWHLTIGNPENPILCIGNLIIDDTEISFPTDSLSWGDFPTKIQFKIKLKPSMAKDRAGIELMFNHGRERIYYTPKTIKINKNGINQLSRRTRGFFDFDTKNIDIMVDQSFDFLEKDTKITLKEVVENFNPKMKPTPTESQQGNQVSYNKSRTTLVENSEL